MAGNSSASHSTEDTHTTNSESKKPYSVTIELDGTITGKDAGKWSSRCGALIRSLIPISFSDWRLVDQVYKKSFWKALLKEFEVNLKPGLTLAVFETKLSRFCRTHKYLLRGNFIHTAANKQAAIEACPGDMDPVIWERFVDNEWDEKKKEQCQKNAENKAKCTIPHGLGRKGYNQVYHDLEKKNPGVKAKRSDAWKITHIGKDGNVLPNTQEKWDAIEAVEKKRKAMSDTTKGSEIDLEYFENDELAEVFGPDKKNRCRAMPSYASMKKIRYGLAAKEIMKQKSVLVQEEFEMRMEAKIKVTVEATVKEAMKEFMKLIDAQHSKNGSASDISGDTHRTEGTSNSLNIQIASKNLNNVSDRVPNLSEKQYVVLCSREEKEVAKGYIATHAICHGKPVARDERIVWVYEVTDPEASIYEAPQGGNYKLCEIADGGFLIWLESRLRYL